MQEAPLYPSDASPPGNGLLPPLLPGFKKHPAPFGYVDRYRMNTPLVVAGGLTLGLTYVAALARGGQDGFKNGMGGLAVPIVGPWIAIGSRKIDCQVTVETGVGGLDDIDTTTDEATECFAKEAANIAVLTGMGIGQLIGATLLAAGLIDRRHYYLRADLAGVSISPVFDTQNVGFLLRGTL